MMSQRGFTLVEALVAFAILAVVLVALYSAIGTGLKGFHRAGQVDAALLVAQSQLDALAALKTMPASLSGSVARSGVEWRADLLADEKAESERLRASPVRLQRVRLTVSWNDGARRSIAVDRTLLLSRAPGG